MKTMIRFRPLPGLLLAVLVLTLAAVMPVRAQDVFADNDATWWTNLDAQLTRALDAPQPHVRKHAMEHITHFATKYPEQVRFTRAAPRLLDVFATDRKASRRMLALTALQAIGDDTAMQQLRMLVEQESSKDVRQQTLTVLADYERGLGTH